MKIAPSMPVYGINKQTAEDLDSILFYQKILWNLMLTQQEIAKEFGRVYPTFGDEPKWIIGFKACFPHIRG